MLYELEATSQLTLALTLPPLVTSVTVPGRPSAEAVFAVPFATPVIAAGVVTLMRILSVEVAG